MPGADTKERAQSLYHVRKQLERALAIPREGKKVRKKLRSLMTREKVTVRFSFVPRALLGSGSLFSRFLSSVSSPSISEGGEKRGIEEGWGGMRE